MHKIRNIEDQLRRDEGEVLHAYRDHLGYLTIGIGRLIDPARGGGISPTESSLLFQNDMARIREQVRDRFPAFLTLDDARQGVLLNMAFQMGVGGLMGFRRMLAHIEAQSWNRAADEMLNSLWATQTPNRARRLALQMRTGIWQ